MKKLKTLLSEIKSNPLKEEQSRSDIEATMKKALECYEYIDKVGIQLGKIIAAEIEPLLKEGKFDEAKDMVREFYKPARSKVDGSVGDVIFIEYDMIFANINRRKTQAL
tara:strand:+ start:3635 stop:3961 length:327 start_codon:yes stop_codon:yes gene_type:complete